ncbi:sulfate ABC transporter substrate-binding protein [Asticcacaulis sp. SL142]|uniref:sulfate ABC transporter substrate-binding protein n=1 Tax=Asticcacaulis sp. SL142 TaxID=2995155 RepID=UPI00226C75E8|nr:sulfate ABC transporter substrate-binding protein [Asticcacaulis sp. SL142]WAC46756.1 sulfate ABC transporter substrate-binding protein [Asticcacaulis sp. SL142]
MKNSDASRRQFLKTVTGAALMTGTATALSACAKPAAQSLLNVSFDPTREFYAAYNSLFAKKYATGGKPAPTFNQSHGGSGKQARAVVDGLKADVLSLALAHDIDAVAATGLLAADWASRLPNNSVAYNSTILLLVRKGNPKGIKDWGDLVKPGVQVITPNPKTSGAARWNYLVAYGWALRANNGDEGKAQAYLEALFKNVPVLDTGARGATTTFIQRGQGDVLINWESEALMSAAKDGAQFDIVYPSLSIAADTPVAWVDKNVAANGTEALAKAYLEGLYDEDAQTLAAQHFYRPTNADVLKSFADRFPAIEQLNIDKDFGGWTTANARHFEQGALFDQISAKVFKA